MHEPSESKKMRLAERARQMPVETAFAQSERLAREGVSFINFAHGDPDQPTPDTIKAAAVTALQQDKTRYSDTSGVPELREAIAEYVGRTRGVHVTGEEVMVLPGANPGVFLALLLMIDEGDEVIYPNPGYPLYPAAITAAGGRAVALPLRRELGYAFDPEELQALIRPRTRVVIVNSPHNPTGAVLSPEHLAVLAEWAERRGFWILSDEVYADLVYEGRASSVLSQPGAQGRVMLIDSFSKSFAMTGWRLGYAVGPRVLIEPLATLFSLVDFSVNTFIQYGGIEALRRRAEIVPQVKTLYRRRRDRIVSLLNTLPGVHCPSPAGSIYVFPEVSGACRRLGLPDDLAFQEALLERCRVALLARRWFGPRNPGEVGAFVRLSYTLPESDVEEAVRRMASFLGGRT